MTPNDGRYREVKKLLAKGEPLTFPMLGDIFGQDFWIILVYTLIDAQDAARAVAGAIGRLKQDAVQEAAAKQVDEKPLIVAG